MARPLRYEEAGAVYHLMARGDGGKNVFEEKKDRFAWTDLLGKAHERFGWRVHVLLLMGNHFHLLLETRTESRGRDEMDAWCLLARLESAATAERPCFSRALQIGSGEWITSQKFRKLVRGDSEKGVSLAV